MEEKTAFRILLYGVIISLLVSVVFLLGTRQELRHESKVGEGQAYVLKLGAVVEIEDPSDGVVKCYLARGDVIRIDLIESVADDRMVTVSYAPVEPGDPAEDIRCPAGTSVTFVEMNVEQLVGK